WTLASGNDLPDRLAGFIVPASNAMTCRITQSLSGLGIGPDQRHGKAIRQERRDAADGSGFPLTVVEGDVALGRRIEFEYAGQTEPLLKCRPDVAAQAVATTQPQPMGGFQRMGRAIQQVAAELADILENG